ncbi:S1/P1 nuclease [Nitzschia inconspicua]|uniref:S1/P1 nuclease n=1 Tax=Nitzschia inconspicua TaxID=303405 RepID=A0A9K3L6Q4_9STRA|nr:S1/P1 nuclease [Nitzschia inconspicua]
MMMTNNWYGRFDSIQTCLCLALFCLVVASLPSCGVAWGELGHEIVANLAWHRLSLQTQHKIEALLNITNTTLIEQTGSPLAAVANWADHVRHFLPWSAELHYIDIRDNLIAGGCHFLPNPHDTMSSCDCDFQYDRDCPEDICVAGAILNYSTQLVYAQKQVLVRSPQRRLRFGNSEKGETFKSIDGMQQSLKFLTHFIGDIHQPLHASRTTDKGGNDIDVQYHLLQKQHLIHVRHANRFTENPASLQRHHPHHHSWNLHSIWDTALIETTLERDYDNKRSNMEDALEALLQKHPEWVDRYNSCGNNAALNNTCVIQWGQESWSYALEYAYTKNEPWKDRHTQPVEVSEGDVLDEDYYITRIPVVNERLIAGGVRLAFTLENIFGQDDSSVDMQDFGGSVLSMWSKLLVGRRH